MTKAKFVLVIVSLVLLVTVLLVPCFADVYTDPEDYAIFPFIYYYLDGMQMDNIASNQLAYHLNSDDKLFSRNMFYSFKVAGGQLGEYDLPTPYWLYEDALLAGQTWFEETRGYFYIYNEDYDYSEFYEVSIYYYLTVVYDQEDRFDHGTIEMFVEDYQSGNSVYVAYYSFYPVINNGEQTGIHVSIDEIYVSPDEDAISPWDYETALAFAPVTDHSALTGMLFPMFADDELAFISCSPEGFYYGYMGAFDYYLTELGDTAYADGYQNGKSLGESNAFLGGIFGDFFSGVTDAINNTTLFIYDNTPVTLGIIFAAGIGIALFIWILKIFAGG